MEGVGRFVLGLSDHIRVLEGDALKDFLREKAKLLLFNASLSKTDDRNTIFARTKAHVKKR